MEYEELSDEVKILIDKEADARCKFKMGQFFESIKNIIHIKESSPDPYVQLAANHLREDQIIILERYRKEMDMGLPRDNMIIEARQEFKQKTEELFDKIYAPALRGSLDGRRIESIIRFIAERIEIAFDLDSTPAKIDYRPYSSSYRYRMEQEKINPTKQ